MSRNNKALLILMNSKNEVLIQDRRGFKRPDWGWFGGGIEEGETPLQAVIREAKEELDLDLAEGDIEHFGHSEIKFYENMSSRDFYIYRTDQEHFEDLEANGAHWLSIEEALKRMEKYDPEDPVVIKLKKMYEQA